jgi:hypothetical protein
LELRQRSSEKQGNCGSNSGEGGDAGEHLPRGIKGDFYGYSETHNGLQSVPSGDMFGESIMLLGAVRTESPNEPRIEEGGFIS